MGIDSLEMRREKLCLKFAKACLNHEKLADLFPRSIKEHVMDKRVKEIYSIRSAKTERFRKSALISMQKMLNNEAAEKRKQMRKISNYMPVNHDCMQSLSLRK